MLETSDESVLDREKRCLKTSNQELHVGNFHFIIFKRGTIAVTPDDGKM